VAPDGKTVAFKLRKDVKFHDGKPFTSADVQFTIMEVLKKAHPRGISTFRDVTAVETPDDYTAIFKLGNAAPYMLAALSGYESPMLPKHVFSQGDIKAHPNANSPIGTGPFKFVEWRRDERLVLERNPDYWQGPADVSRVTFRFIPEFSARMAALLSGEIDVMKDVPPHAVEAIEKSGRAKLRSTVSSRINYLALVNLKPGPMQDVRVRRAMNHAVDYAPVECYKHDPARAQALFKEAGVDPTKLALTLDTPSGRYPLDKDISLAIAAQLQRLGIKTNVVVNEWGTHLDKIKNRNTGDMFFLGWGPALYGQNTMQPLFLADQTYSSYGNNKAIDDKIGRAQTLLEPKARAEAYADLQKVVHDEAPWVFLWQQHDLYGVTQAIEWTPRADEKVWMYDAKIVAK
jgi:peptide/nickel transport system substrate-binding protein